MLQSRTTETISIILSNDFRGDELYDISVLVGQSIRGREDLVTCIFENSDFTASLGAACMARQLAAVLGLMPYLEEGDAGILVNTVMTAVAPSG